MSKESKEKKVMTEEQVVAEQVEEIEEQYRILKDEEEKEEKRKIILLLTLFFMVFAISFAGATFSYITYKNSINRKNSEEIKEGNGNGDGSDTNPEDLANKSMQVLFTSGAEFIAEEVTPGWQSASSKEFSVKNTGNLDAQYSIKFTDIENEFVDLKDLKYTLTCNGEELIKDGDLPTEPKIVLPGEVIKVGETKTYDIYFKYLETGTNQNKDSGKTYKLTVDVTNEEN